MDRESWKRNGNKKEKEPWEILFICLFSMFTFERE